MTAQYNKTQFLYNGADQLERIIKADGTERIFDYDSEERCTFRRDEDGNTVRMGYNLDGNMVLASGTPEGLGALDKQHLQIRRARIPDIGDGREHGIPL